jgi:hypothetical protein
MTLARQYRETLTATSYKTKTWRAMDHGIPVLLITPENKLPDYICI